MTDSSKLPAATAESAIARPQLVSGGTHVGNPPPLPVTVQPTQLRRPGRATARTLFQAFVAFCVLFPLLVREAGLDVSDFPWLAVPLAVAAAVARIMALPQVEAFLRRFVPWLAAAPRQ